MTISHKVRYNDDDYIQIEKRQEIKHENSSFLSTFFFVNSVPLTTIALEMDEKVIKIENILHAESSLLML